MSLAADLEQRITAIRSFNRFYTQQIGLLHDGMVDSPYSLAEARVIYEIGRRSHPIATEIALALDLDPGYLSRIIAKFVEQDVVTKWPLAADRRQFQLRLTPKGRRVFARLDRGSHDIIATMLAGLGDNEQRRIVDAMSIVQNLLAAPAAEKTSYQIRPHQPGDMGWVVARHGALYAEEFGWDNSFEALIAEIVASFIRNYDPAREHCWIAELDGAPVGSVFLVKETDTIAKLRLLLVEPKARGLGIGRRLVHECVQFSRQSGYERITLWTQSILTAARDIYESAGFARVKQQPHRSFGHDLMGETWELEL